MFRCVVSNGVPSPGGTVVYSNAATLTVTEMTYAYFEDFGDMAGVNPADWLDTGADNSLVENGSLFQTYDVGGEIAFGTTSTATNIHSHYTAASYDAGVGIVLTGRMRMSAATSGIGVTFLSDYPNEDTYYRLRRYGSTAFHIDPHGTTIAGDIDSGVVPTADTWYLYKIEVVDNTTDSQTEIRAKVWPEGSAEPTGWQIDARDASDNRRTSGKIGVWSMGAGNKYWDDLQVTMLSSPTQYTLTVNTAGTGAGSVDLDPAQPAGGYNVGTVVTLTATAGTDSEFTEWGGMLSGSDNPTTITMDADKTVTATFATVPTYTLTVNPVGNGSVVLSPPGGVYAEDTVVTLTATAGTDSEFTEWGGMLSGSDNPTTITMDADKTVTATFATVPTYTLTVNPVGNGSVVLSPPGGVYAEDTVVTLTATAGTDSEFTEWGGMLSGSDNPTTITMDADKTVTATFATVPTYTLTVNPVGNGSVVLSPPGGVYAEDTVVTLTATAGTDSEFTEWGGMLSGSDNPTTITMDADKTVTATFATVPTYTLTVNPVGNGSVVLSPPGGVYAEDTVVTLTATAGTDSEFTEWGGMLSGSDNPTTITMDADKTVTATFATVPTYTLTVNPVGNGSVVLSPPGGVYAEDTVVTLTATAGTDSEFTEWGGMLSGSDNPTTITMDADKTVTATFEESTSAYFEDFGDTAGVSPADWLDTGANNSLVEDDSLFTTMAVDGGIAFGTSSTATNIHSHYTAASYDAGVGFVLTGRMRMSAVDSGIGVTFLSDYPNSDTYYRLRRYGSTAFHIDPHGTTVAGVIDSGVVPTAATWYLYKIEVVDNTTDSQTEIRAKVWAEGSPEPTGWQIDAYDASGSRRTSGKIGVWSMGAGSKYWDDLTVEMLAPANQPPVADGEATPPAGAYPLEVELDGSASYDPDGSIVLYEWDFEGDGTYDYSSASSGVTTNNYMSSGIFDAVLRVTDNESVTGTTSVTVTVSEPGQPASIVSHPADQSVTEGASATFTVVAAGTAPISYQWQFWNGDAWVDMFGEESSTYTLDETIYSEDDGAMFQCHVYNAVEPSGVYSDPATLEVIEALYDFWEDFGDTAGVNPSGWLDTGASNSLAENDSLFATMAVDGGIAFGTTSTATNIHSHYTAASYDAGVGFLLTGRMRMSAADSGIGVTFLSDYPNKDTYYRLRRYGSTAFHIDPHGTTVAGVIDSGVVPVANTWYQYRIEVVDTGSQTEIRANIWPEGSAEPTGWQIDAYDASGSRRASGRIGVWSMGSGSKYWDDLMVQYLP